MNIKKLSQLIFIASIFATSTQISFAQDKTKLINQLIDLTILDFPSAQVRKPLQEAQEKTTESLKSELTKSFTEAIDADDKYNANQKANLKEHLPELTEDLSKRFMAKLQISFSNNVMIRESMRESYEKLSVAELNKTISFVKTPAGKSFVKFMGDLAVSILERSNTEPQEPKKYEAQIERFGKTSAGEKFLKAFVEDSTKLYFEKANSFVENYLAGLDQKEFQAIITDFKNKYSK